MHIELNDTENDEEHNADYDADYANEVKTPSSNLSLTKNSDKKKKHITKRSL